MERNDDLTNTTGGIGGLGNSSSSPSFGSAGSTGAGAGFGTSGSGMGAGSSGMGSGGSEDATSRMQNAKEVASEKFGQAKSAVSSGLGTVKEKASTLNTSIADKLEAGANKLRQNAGSGSPYAPSTGIDGAAALSSDQGAGQLGAKAADALQGTANFLREGDLKASIEQQVRTNPARTLLVALGVGYVLGKALRSDR